MKDDEYREKDIKIKREQLKWTKIQAIMTIFLTMVIATYAIMNFGKQYPDLGTTTLSIATLIALGLLILRVANKAMKNNP